MTIPRRATGPWPGRPSVLGELPGGPGVLAHHRPALQWPRKKHAAQGPQGSWPLLMCPPVHVKAENKCASSNNLKFL